MEEGIFISYSNHDKKKVDLLVREINLNGKFKPIVIASDREALKPLAKKVADGLIKAEFVIPILTENSIFNQWVNQEIGFATGLNKTIIPIIDKTKIDSLKGFIHKNIDLPYSFSSNSNSRTESLDFLKAVRSLIRDLDALHSKSISIEKPSSDLEESINKFEAANNAKQALEEKKQYLNSSAGMKDAQTEAKNILYWAEKKITELNARNIVVDWSKEVYFPKVEIRYGEFKFEILWKQQYPNQNITAYLQVQKFKLDSRDEFVSVEKQIYTFDINDDDKPIWNNSKEKSKKQSLELITENLNWLITENAKKI